MKSQLQVCRLGQWKSQMSWRRTLVHILYSTGPKCISEEAPEKMGFMRHWAAFVGINSRHVWTQYPVLLNASINPKWRKLFWLVSCAPPPFTWPLSRYINCCTKKNGLQTLILQEFMLQKPHELIVLLAIKLTGLLRQLTSLAHVRISQLP